MPEHDVVSPTHSLALEQSIVPPTPATQNNCDESDTEQAPYKEESKALMNCIDELMNE